MLTVFAKTVEFLEDQEAEIPVGKDFITNEVVLDGYICRKPIYRKTPFGREIADVLLAVNRSYISQTIFHVSHGEEMQNSVRQ